MGVWAKFPFLKTSFFKRGEQYILLHVYNPPIKSPELERGREREHGYENMIYEIFYF